MFFGVIDLVAAVGLWLAAPWGAVVWLTSVISMVAVEVLFPQIYGGRMWVVAIDVRPDIPLSLAGADGGARAAAVMSASLRHLSEMGAFE